MTFLGETEHFSGKIEALRWGILVGKQKHNVQKPTHREESSRLRPLRHRYSFHFRNFVPRVLSLPREDPGNEVVTFAA